ncbi:MAG TPA: M20/M25/M40 family metallo-hydrolase [Solirubrobacteraceae bacterium]|nr:M20/M25/M40 family metallo-hydrolase [Solirubrobacteraceae bacterium]
MDEFIATAAVTMAGRAERELEALVGVSSPSGDVQGAEEAVAVCVALLPEQARVERVPCSTSGSAPDLLAVLEGKGARRLLLLGHLDTVVAHQAHLPLRREADRLYGPGAADMKGGVVLAIGLMRALAGRPDRFAELTILLVTDEEWRTQPFRHAERFRGYDACLCFEAGERGPQGEEGVVVLRKAAGTLRAQAIGRSAHSGSAPDQGANALLALAQVASSLAGLHAPSGPDRLSVVPTILRSGDAFNVVPAHGELVFDLRARDRQAFAAVLAAIPEAIDGVSIEANMERVWPGMDTRSATGATLEAASRLLGRPIVGVARGGASDASHLALEIPLTVDGLGPRGGGAHTPQEFVLAASLQERAEVGLAMAGAVLEA